MNPEPEDAKNLRKETKLGIPETIGKEINHLQKPPLNKQPLIKHLKSILKPTLNYSPLIIETPNTTLNNYFHQNNTNAMDPTQTWDYLDEANTLYYTPPPFSTKNKGKQKEEPEPTTTSTSRPKKKVKFEVPENYQPDVIRWSIKDAEILNSIIENTTMNLTDQIKEAQRLIKPQEMDPQEWNDPSMKAFTETMLEITGEDLRPPPPPSPPKEPTLLNRFFPYRNQVEDPIQTQELTLGSHNQPYQPPSERQPWDSNASPEEAETTLTWDQIPEQTWAEPENHDEEINTQPSKWEEICFSHAGWNNVPCQLK